MVTSVAHIITDLGGGGAEAALCRLCAASRAEFRHIVISLMDRGVYARPLEQMGVQVYCLGMRRGRVTVRGMLRLYDLLRDVRPAIVQTWMYHADLLGGAVARLSGVRPVIWSIHNFNLDADSNKGSTLWVVRACGLLSWWIPERVISCSKNAVRVHEKWGYDVRKFAVIPNGYPLNEFRPDSRKREEMRRELGLSNDVPVLGMVGRFDRNKDHGNLLEALRRLQLRGTAFRCLLVGANMDENNEELIALVRQAGLEKTVLLLGRRGDIPAVMNALDVHVLASRGEAFPNVIAEAMACGTPCVTTDVGDAAFIVGETGWVVPPRNPEELANAIATALTARAHDLSTWQKRQLACRQRIVDRFSVEKMAAAYKKVWEEAVAGSKGDSRYNSRTL